MPTSLRDLSRADCLALLRGAKVGRVGVSVDALPAIFPVFIAVVDDIVVFRTVPGTKLHAAGAGAGAIVAVEVDRIDEASGEGWSVLVRGVAHELTDGPRLGPARTRLGTTWFEGTREHLVEVSTDLVTGRRLG